MARQEVTIVFDDLDGTQGEDVAEVVFGWRSSIYAIDLAEANTKRFAEAIGPFLDKARKVGPLRLNHLQASNRRSIPPVKTDRERNQAIRDWAREQGHEISNRGRIPAEIVEEFEQAH